MFDQVDSYHRPRSIREAVRLLQSGGGGARVVAGGTDVIVEADRSIRSLVDITQLGLNYIRRAGDAWVIGATTTLKEVEDSAALRALAGGIIGRAAATCGSIQLRNMATLGGNLANASPAADTAVPLLALDARVVVTGSTSKRTVPLQKFFAGPGKTVVGKALLTEIQLPIPPKGGHWGWSFQKLGRTETDISLVSAVVGLQVDGRGKCKCVRIALGAVAPTPIRATAAETLLTGQKLTADLLAQACEQASLEASPISDVRASADYRRNMVRVLVERALQDCATQAGVTL